MATCPKLIIIAEHQACAHTQDWLQRIQDYAALLEYYPSVVLQLRAKNTPQLLEKAYHMLSSHTRIFVNTTPEHAKQLNLHNLHIPQRHIPRENLASTFGISIHQLEDVAEYTFLKPLYFQFGPIFDPLSKNGHGCGLEALSQILYHSTIPIVAVGGITPPKARILFDMGCTGVASIGYMMHHSNPRQALDDFFEVYS